MSRKYYSNRTGKNSEASRYELPMFVKLFKIVYLDFLNKDYFQQNFSCQGADIEAQMFLAIRKSDLSPIEEKCNNYSEDDHW
ncbi:hypothetical protein [Microcoleus sp. Pol11C3]|uniref:hypothetical protein n=1 Tax=Microcoleus sp. Pol11C3 TaxID=3055390 RepID=UPI002FD570EA